MNVDSGHLICIVLLTWAEDNLGAGRHPTDVVQIDEVLIHEANGVDEADFRHRATDDAEL